MLVGDASQLCRKEIGYCVCSKCRENELEKEERRWLYRHRNMLEVLRERFKAGVREMGVSARIPEIPTLNSALVGGCAGIPKNRS